jgi:mRNA-degrading endonuclease YafQ of YafQ-DinJ toxin-antitoxin module
MKILRSHTTSRFEKDFLNLNGQLRNKAEKKIKIFEENCFHGNLGTHKLKGVLAGLWAFSIDDDYRVIFKFLPGQEIIYYRIGPHRIYRELEKVFR